MTTSSTSPFKQPLYYLDESEIHPITELVDRDLEFHSRESETTPGAIDILCSPKTPFAKQQCDAVQHFTSSPEYLEKTQLLLTKLSPDLFRSTSAIFSTHDSKYPREYEAFTNPEIKAKYGFLEWSSLEHLNENSMFLQCMSYVHLTSPILAFLIPVVFFILPFFLLKLQNVPITFQQYLETLRSIAKHHFIGKMLNIKSFSLENISYVLFLAAIYGIQLYQNYYACIHFYQNMKLLNTNLNSLKTYLRETHHNMHQFIQICTTTGINQTSGYNEFIGDLKKQAEHIKHISLLFEPISEKFISFSNISKLQEFGYMLTCYYNIYNNEVLRETIEYAFGFDGYLQNMQTIHLKIFNNSSELGFASFISDFSLECDAENGDENGIDVGEKIDDSTENGDEIGGKCERNDKQYTKIIDQYYLFLSNDTIVKNSVYFEKGNMIITGVNASGKTTALKTTALNIIFSQIYGIGFYKEASIYPYHYIHSYLNIPDTSGRDSLFQAESRRCKEIIDSVERNPGNKRHFCIFDELYSGTNPREATKSAYSFLNYLLKKQNVDFMLTTHYVSLCKKFENDTENNKRVFLYQMQVDIGEKGEFVYTYELNTGICELEGGVEILKQMNYPDEIIDEIERA